MASQTLDATSAAGLWPILRPGDVITLESATRLRVGDLLVFDDAVQRLVWIDPFEQLWVCADSMGSEPSRRDKQDVRGVVTGIVRDGKPAALEAKRPSLTAYVEIALKVGRELLSASGQTN